MMESRNGVIIPLFWMLVCSAWIFPQTVGEKVSLQNDLMQRNGGFEAMREEDETIRVDPLNHFKKYRGGYNITNKHYWSSTIFTGGAGYGIGVAWLLSGIGYGGFLVATLCCGLGIRGKKKLNTKITNCGHKFYLWTILLAAFFTILAIVGCGLVIGGSTKFDKEAKKVVKIIIETANGASNTIQNTTSAMKHMISNLQEEASTTTLQTSATLTSTSHKLDAQAANIQRQANKNRLFIHNGLNIMYIVTMVTISLNLGAVIALSVFGILRLQKLFHIFIVLCWLLTAVCWIFFGLYLFLNNFSSDTCKALEMFQENPNNNSLSSILPCEQLLAAKSVLTDVSSEIYDLVNQVNTHISVSYPDISLVCNPFSEPPYYEYQPQNCAVNTIRIGDIPKVLKLLTCSDERKNGIGGCENGEFMSKREYKTVEAYTNSIQGFLNVYPGMESLVECQTLKHAFSLILLNHCKPLDTYATMVWAGLAFVSLLMVSLVLIWTIITPHYHLHQTLPNSP